MTTDSQLEEVIQEIFDHYGLDFSGYSKASFKRRIDRIINLDEISHFQEFIYKIKTDINYVRRIVEEITVNVTEMFRDPHFYKIVRQEIIPVLATKPFIRIWHAGCSTGEEVYSMAILLEEAGVLQKSILYATDLSTRVLENAKKGVFPLRNMKQYSENYIAASGKKDFSSYYIANYNHAKFNENLSKRMVFSIHNLVSDKSFNEFDLILCRNVLIYFDKDLQDKALMLFDESLSSLGYLALGTKESIKFSNIQNRYRQLQKEKIWRKMN
ncbi:protein-glutamate O-methyltransferase CheR [Flavobacterium sp. NST-5]|uniref:Protein-glutamate O-methyltransferase CheR n=1 Tax=Flavobacterium ichthyis TaxID=2698827 RepID=A0ABW9ZCA6_9FLAO|nr:protein-glutamate O-methyltransferase CheR [Flavobacterium ichthyis]NBL65726.1 protein-glutamate O-methyltransferase CheR [Flavobacterium ichthyis]